MSEMITISYDLFKSILIELVEPDGRIDANVFNRSPESSKYGTARCTLADHGSTYAFGLPIFKIEFHSPEMKTLFLLRFGQYLK